MAEAGGKYVRVYYTIRSDPKFERVYGDDRALAAWLRLLLDADAVWPEPASLPRAVGARQLQRLVDAGLIDLLPGHAYRVHGLDREREMRAQSGRTAAAMRWQSAGNAVGNATPMLVRERERERERERADSDASASDDDDGRADLEAWLLVRRRPPTERQRAVLDAYCRTFDVTGPQRAERLILEHPDDPIAALKADLDEFRKERLAEARAAERKPAASGPRRTNGLTPVNIELARLLSERYAAEAEPKP